MDTIKFLAELWGFSLIIIPLAVLLRPKSIKSLLTLAEQETALIIWGIANTLLGIAQVLAYNVWEGSWQVVLTILGWILVIRGIVALVYPAFISQWATKIHKHLDWATYALVVAVILGCFLLYMGINMA